MSSGLLQGGILPGLAKNPAQPSPKAVAALLLWMLLAGTAARGQGMTPGMVSPPANLRPPGLKHVGIEQHLNQQIPPSLSFQDEAGRPVKLADYFGRKPLILNLVYYRCPMLCGEVLSGLVSALRILKFDVGGEFDVLTVSFDPNDTPAMAAAKKAELLKRYGRPGAAEGWHFLTGTQAAIDGLTQSAGFEYEYDPRIQQFAHATAILILTPQGRIAQYYYGIEFPPRDLRLGLVQASENKIGSVADQVLLYCYHYDPDQGKYGAIITRVLQLAAAATIVVLGTFLIAMFRLGSVTEHRHKQATSRDYV
ncbi:MAG TPA: SCO family protein [Terriglobales bacterium]|nr:SCO family protein [Terriglobales bacterium]